MARRPQGRLPLAVFDCDGTLLDSQHGIIACMAEAFAAVARPAPAAPAVRRIVGLNLDEAIAALAPAATTAELAAIVEAYRAAFPRLIAAGAAETVYPGIVEVLEALDRRGVRLAVATGKSRRGLDAVLRAAGIDRLFVSLQTPDRHPGKPHPAMLRAAIEDVGTVTRDTVMIGDTTYDVRMARNANVRAIGVGWGYHGVAELTAAGATRIIATPGELNEAVMQVLEV